MKIYRKLYFWFLLVFIFTLITVLSLATHFYGNAVHDDIEEQVLSHAKFLQEEYSQYCGEQSSIQDCRRFFMRIRNIPLLRFWVVDRSGRILNSTENFRPRIQEEDLSRAKKGENVLSFHRRSPFQAILPFSSTSGTAGQFLVIERAFPRRDRFPRLPLLSSLLISGIVIALLVLPLSLRLTKPLRELHELGQEWAEGHLEKRATPRGKDEIAELATVFNKMAANLNIILQQRKEFLALISHELKSPLARMKIALELLEEKVAASADRDHLIRTMHQEIGESEGLIEQLLVLSRIEMNPPNFAVIRIDSAVQRAAKQMELIATDGKVTVKTQAQPSEVWADEIQLQRAIVNILENAIKFSPPDATVFLGAETHGDILKIECRDAGPGIAEEEREKIFQPFYRGRNDSEKKGSGLGLFIARRIVEMHRGNIRAHSNPGGGTMITMEIPVKPPQPSVSDSQGS